MDPRINVRFKWNIKMELGTTFSINSVQPRASAPYFATFFHPPNLLHQNVIISSFSNFVNLRSSPGVKDQVSRPYAQEPGSALLDFFTVSYNEKSADMLVLE
jgi:hypothetical protein